MIPLANAFAATFHNPRRVLTGRSFGTVMSARRVRQDAVSTAMRIANAQ